jgi:hypothetical protein
MRKEVTHVGDEEGGGRCCREARECEEGVAPAAMAKEEPS